MSAGERYGIAVDLTNCCAWCWGPLDDEGLCPTCDALTEPPMPHATRATWPEPPDDC